MSSNEEKALELTDEEREQGDFGSAPSPTANRRKVLDVLYSAGLFLCLGAVYFATASGITCSNDGSHYALTRALAEQGRFSIEQYESYTYGDDLARRGGDVFSDRPPGTALLASVFYALGRHLPDPPGRVPSLHDKENPLLVYVMLLPAWAGAGAVVALYLMLRRLSVSQFTALTTCLMFGIGTVHWKYSSVLFSHSLSSLTVLTSILLATGVRADAGIRWARTWSLGFVLGWAVLVEYSNAVMVIIAVAYSAFVLRKVPARRLFRFLVLLLAGGAGPAIFLGYYNTVNFGNPLTSSYSYATNYPWAASFSTTFDRPLWEGLRALIVWGTCGDWHGFPVWNQGILVMSPLLVLALPGFVYFFRHARRECVLTTGILVFYLCLFATHRTAHGFTADGRYASPFLGLWVLPLGFFLDRVVFRLSHPLYRSTVYVFTYGLFFLSARNVFLHIGRSYNYGLDLTRLADPIASPYNLSYLLKQVFLNVRNLPYFVVLSSAALLVLLGIARLVLRSGHRSRRTMGPQHDGRWGRCAPGKKPVRGAEGFQRIKNSRSFAAGIEQHYLKAAPHPGVDETRERLLALPISRVVLQWVGTHRRVADLGCHKGALTALIRDQGNEAVGVDLPGIVRQARTEQDLAFVGHDLNEPFPFEDQEFDVVVAASILDYVAGDRSFLLECYRVLRPGGSLIVVVPNEVSWYRRIQCLCGGMSRDFTVQSGFHTLHWYTLRGIKDLLAGTGFEVRECVKCPKRFSGIPFRYWIEKILPTTLATDLAVKAVRSRAHTPLSSTRRQVRNAAAHGRKDVGEESQSQAGDNGIF